MDKLENITPVFCPIRFYVHKVNGWLWSNLLLKVSATGEWCLEFVGIDGRKFVNMGDNVGKRSKMKVRMKKEKFYEIAMVALYANQFLNDEQ